VESLEAHHFDETTPINTCGGSEPAEVLRETQKKGTGTNQLWHTQKKTRIHQMWRT
jgi:hypothetical protein